MTIRIERLTDPAQEARARVEALLSAHAAEAGHPFTNTRCILEAWDGETFAGGVHAKIGSHWVFVELLAVAPSHRGTGLGKAFLDEIEAIAQSEGKSGIWLDTYSFQAPGFYARHGYNEIGRIEDYPPGQSRIFFQKRL